MIDDETLSGLGDHLVPVGRQLGEIERRAGAIRRRRGLTAAGSTLAIGLVIAGAVITPSMLRPDPATSHPAMTPTPVKTPAHDTRVAPTAPMAKNCSAEGHHVSDDLAAPVRYLPDPSSGWTVKYGPADISQTVSNCVDPAEIVRWYSGPAIQDSPFFEVMGPLTPTTGLDSRPLVAPAADAETVQIGTALGRLEILQVTGQIAGFLTWQAADGSFWYASTGHLTRTQILAAANSVVITGGELDLSQRPAGLSEMVPPLVPVAAEKANIELSAQIAHGRTMTDLSVRRGTIEPAAFTSRYGRLVDVNGRPGVIRSTPPRRSGGEITVTIWWSLPDGVTASYIGMGVSEEELLALAKATAPVPATDPRLR